MNTKIIILSLLLGLFSANLLAQSTKAAPKETAPAQTESEFEKEYQKRIKKDYIFGVYIPKDLSDAFIQLNKLIDKESQAKFKSVDEAAAVEKLHFSLGRWMIYNWSFYEGSRFSVYLRNLGIYKPDDMAKFVIRSYHRNLNRTSLGVKEQIEQVEQKKKEEQAAKIKGGTILHEEKRKRQN